MYKGGNFSIPRNTPCTYTQGRTTMTTTNKLFLLRFFYVKRFYYYYYYYVTSVPTLLFAYSLNWQTLNSTTKKTQRESTHLSKNFTHKFYFILFVLHFPSFSLKLFFLDYYYYYKARGRQKNDLAWPRYVMVVCYCIMM